MEQDQRTYRGNWIGDLHRPASPNDSRGSRAHVGRACSPPGVWLRVDPALNTGQAPAARSARLVNSLPRLSELVTPALSRRRTVWRDRIPEPRCWARCSHWFPVRDRPQNASVKMFVFGFTARSATFDSNARARPRLAARILVCCSTLATSGRTDAPYASPFAE